MDTCFASKKTFGVAINAVCSIGLSALIDYCDSLLQYLLVKKNLGISVARKIRQTGKIKRSLCSVVHIM